MSAQLTTTLWARARHLSQPLMTAHRLKHWLAVFLALEVEPVGFLSDSPRYQRNRPSYRSCSGTGPATRPIRNTTLNRAGTRFGRRAGRNALANCRYDSTCP